MRIILLILGFILIGQIVVDVVLILKSSGDAKGARIGAVLDENIVKLTAGLCAFVTSNIINENRLRKSQKQT